MFSIYNNLYNFHIFLSHIESYLPKHMVLTNFMILTTNDEKEISKKKNP